MNRYFLSAAVGSVLLFTPVWANPTQESLEPEFDPAENLSWDTDGYSTRPIFNLNLRKFAPSSQPFAPIPQPSVGGAPPGSLLLGKDDFYGQLQAGVFGNNNVGDQWSAFGAPGPTVTGIYGLRYNWEQDFATFSLNNVNATRKDATIGFGSGTDSQLNINFINTGLVATTVANFFPAAGLRVKSAARLGLETSNSEVPSVTGGTGPSPLLGITTTGYTGIITRRTSDRIAGAANNGRVLARTNSLTLQRDGTNAGLRIGYLVASGSPYVVCSAVTSGGLVITKVFTPIVEVQPGPGVVTPNTIFTDVQGAASVHCSFGNAPDNGNVTTVDILRKAGTFNWIGTLTSTFNQ